MKTFNNNKFWKIIKSNFKLIGYDLLNKILCMYYCFLDPRTPLWVKNFNSASYNLYCKTS